MYVLHAVDTTNVTKETNQMGKAILVLGLLIIGGLFIKKIGKGKKK